MLNTACLTQAACISRYHKHLQKLGRAESLEVSARTWIGKYAALWRAKATRRP